VGDRVVDGVRAGETPFPAVDRLLADGTLRLMTVAEGYAATGRFSAERQFEFYDGATRRAVAEGYAGLRVVAELTALAADPLRRAELLRWEQLADRYVVDGPGLTAMCAYRGDLPPAALADVASAHPAASAPTGMPQFRLFFDEDRLVLSGGVDISEADRLARLLGGSPSAPAVLLDLGRLDFVDLAGCRVIARWVGDLCARGVTVEIRGASSLFRRMWHLLDLSGVAPVAFGESSG
jgi:ABC-type transporter Mla MlaB component